MTQEFDINTIASWATVAVAIAAGGGFLRKGSRWFERTDERLKTLEGGQETLADGQTKLEEGQASTAAELAEIKDEQCHAQERLDSIDAQLRPNGGGSHHDVIRREIREAVEEAADGGRKRRRH